MKFSAKSEAQNQQAGKTSMPFIGLIGPFVGRARPQIGPFIGKTRPSIKIPAYSGFSLIELIVTMTIAGVLMSLAAPGFSNFVKNNRLSGQANAIMADLAFARSEAVKRGAPVTICRSKDGAGCLSGTEWHEGWIVVNAAGQVLRMHEALDGKNTLTGTGNLADQTTYAGTGLIGLGATESFRLCDDRDAPYGRLIDISATGRAALVKDAAGHPTPPASC